MVQIARHVFFSAPGKSCFVCNVPTKRLSSDRLEFRGQDFGGFGSVCAARWLIRNKCWSAPDAAAAYSKLWAGASGPEQVAIARLG
mmetsp:Transcript_13696/g.25967  ORF Transcript_13696/g.25967 Transcript_13696/m.25967 type:complete len:86 (-) Transcript_13696:154-411(-)